MKKTVTAFVFMEQDLYPLEELALWKPSLWPFKMDESETSVFIGEQTFEVEVPDEFDPVPKQVAALRKQQDKALALYQQTVAEINERLIKLLAITNDVRAT